MSVLIELAREIVTCHGGVVEEGAAGVEALLPKDLAAGLAVPEHVTFVEGHTGGEGQLSYGSALLERMVELARATVPVAGATLPAGLPRVAGVAAAALERFTGINCVLRAPLREPSEAWGGYLVVDYRYSADADERREGLVRVVINEESGADVSQLHGLDADPALEPGLPLLPLPAPPDVLLARAGRAAQRRARSQLAAVAEATHRRHRRDRQRLTAYFTGLRAEMEVQLERTRCRRPGADELAARQAKIDALGLELERKLADLAVRYRLRVELAPVAVLRVAVRVRRVELCVRRRQKEGVVAVHQSAATRGFDPLSCQACAEPVHAFALCDEALHVLCAACDQKRPSPRHCPACQATRDRTL